MVAESHQSPRASSRDRSCSPRATATRGRCGPTAPDVGGNCRRQAQPEKGAPRSTTREDTTRSIVASPPHFDASSLSVQTVCRPARQQRQGRCPASHRVAHRASGRCAADADRGGSRSRCGSLRYAMTAFSYLGTLARPCRAPGATLWREKRLLQRQRDHIADSVKRKKNRCSVTAGLSL